MSTLKTGALRGTSGTADSVQLHASNQSVTFPGNVTVSGDLTGGGKIIKHYEASFNGNQTYYGNGGSNYADTYLTITFTPQKTGTVALIYVFTTVDTNDAKYGFFRLKRTQGGSSADVTSNNLASKGYDMDASGGVWTPVQFMVRYNTTMTAGTDRTYTVTIRTHPGSGSNEVGVG